MALGKDLDPTDLTKRVAAIIRAQMGYKDMSQADLVRATGFSQAAISRLIKGTRALDIEQLNVICGVLRISPASVLTEAEEHVRNHATVTELRPAKQDNDDTAQPLAARRGKGKLQDDAMGDDA